MDMQILQQIATILVVTGLPAFGIGYVFGGKGIFRGFLLLCAAVLAWLIWVFAIKDNCCPTGMEGLVLFIAPAVVAAIGVWMGVCYCMLAVFGVLPVQRFEKDGR